MFKTKPIFLLLLPLLLTGCSLTPVPTDLSTRQVSFPDTGVVQTAEVGSPLVERANITEFKGIRTSTAGKCLNFVGAGPVFEAGDTLPEHELSGKILYCGAVKIQNAYGQIWEGRSCIKETDTGSYKFDLGAECEGTSWQKGKYAAVSPDNVQRTLLYNGKSGNEVYFDYREFNNNMARPAFTQSLTFDLSEDNVVGFRGMRLEILEATNTQIQYRLLANFSD